MHLMSSIGLFIPARLKLPSSAYSDWKICVGGVFFVFVAAETKDISCISVFRCRYRVYTVFFSVFATFSRWCTVLRFVRKLLHRIVSVDEVYEWDTLVFDTSSLSHAFEEFSHAAVSAYMEMKPPREWERLKERLERRFSSEFTTRKLLLKCDRMSCLVPRGVVEELSRDPHYQDSLDILLGRGWRVEEKYVKRRSGRGDPRGFTETFKPRLTVESPPQKLVEYVLQAAERMGKQISREDAEGIALALHTNGILVTADRKQAEVANALGIRVLFTIPKAKKPEKVVGYGWYG